MSTMRSRPRTRSGIAGALLALAAQLSSGCAPTPAHHPAALPPAEDPIAYEFDVAGDDQDRLRKDVADINGVPIYVWIERAPGREILSIRITGHATEEVCSKASMEIIQFLTGSADVEGFLSFGVGELRPRRGSTTFQARAEQLLRTLASLSQANPEYIRLTEIPSSPPVREPAPPHFDPGETRVAVVRHRPPALGPEFIPVRRWAPGEAPTPIHFDLDASAMGVDPELMAQMTRDMAIGPVLEQVEHFRTQLRRLDRAIQWRSSKESLLRPDTVGIRHGLRARSPAYAELEASTELMEWFVAVSYAVVLASNASVEWERGVEADTLRLEAAISHNRRCWEALRSGRGCFGYHHAEPLGADSDAKRTQINSMVSELNKIPVAKLYELRAEIRVQLDEYVRYAEMLRRTTPARRIEFARESTVDGLLRGWPIPASDETVAEAIDATQAETIPAAWTRLLSTLATDGGPDLREPGRVAGALERATVFYRVSVLPGGRFRVTPYHVVIGPYMEVWDVERHTVTIETPWSKAGVDQEARLQ